VLAGALPETFNSKLFVDHPTTRLSDHYAPFFKTPDFLQGLMNAELRTKLVDDLLSVDDTMSMAHSLELRVPLLDNRVVDLMSILPWQMKYRTDTFGKLLLRKVVREVLPEPSLRKPKWGFSVNVSAWYRGELGELVRQIVPESEVIKRYFNRQVVKKLIGRPFSTNDRRYHALLWQLLGFHLWHRLFIDWERVGVPTTELDALVA
jgi:asparagine synthase (glutamine-hydrolysing)